MSVGIAAALFLCLLLKSPAIMGGVHRLPVATLTSVSLGGFPLKTAIVPAVNPTGVWPLWFLSPVPVARVYLTGVVVQ